MKRSIVIILLVGVSSLLMHAQYAIDSVRLQVSANDTFYLARMQDVWVYPKMVFKNKQQERFYWRTVRDVKKTLPYAKLIKQDILYADSVLRTFSTEKEKRQWWRRFEKQLFRKYEKDFRGMYASQGMMLMKLVNRETQQTGYNLIKHYKGKFSANFWQFIAKLFKNDLKEEYDEKDKDRIVERVIILVESGQL
mgnify:CR=1 FL=1